MHTVYIQLGYDVISLATHIFTSRIRIPNMYQPWLRRSQLGYTNFHKQNLHTKHILALATTQLAGLYTFPLIESAYQTYISLGYDVVSWAIRMYTYSRLWSLNNICSVWLRRGVINQLVTQLICMAINVADPDRVLYVQILHWKNRSASNRTRVRLWQNRSASDRTRICNNALLPNANIQLGFTRILNQHVKKIYSYILATRFWLYAYSATVDFTRIMLSYKHNQLGYAHIQLLPLKHILPWLYTYLAWLYKFIRWLGFLDITFRKIL